MAKHGYGVPVDLSKCSNQPALYNRLYDKIIASTHIHLPPFSLLFHPVFPVNELSETVDTEDPLPPQHPHHIAGSTSAAVPYHAFLLEECRIPGRIEQD